MKTVLALAFALSALVACNTVQGVGKDIQSGGQAIQDGARSVQEELSQ